MIYNNYSTAGGLNIIIVCESSLYTDTEDNRTGGGGGGRDIFNLSYGVAAMRQFHYHRLGLYSVTSVKYTHAHRVFVTDVSFFLVLLFAVGVNKILFIHRNHKLNK